MNGMIIMPAFHDGSFTDKEWTRSKMIKDIVTC